MNEPTEVNGRNTHAASSGLTFVGLLASAVVAAVLIGAITGPDPPPPNTEAVADESAPDLLTGPTPEVPIGVESLRRCPVQLGGMRLGNHQTVRGSALERWVCDALNGPWSLVIRAAGGNLALRSAVATYPVDLLGSGVPSTRPKDGVWNPGTRKLVWPLGGSYAQIVGDLGQSTLENLATRITAEGGKPQFQALDGFTAGAISPYRSALVHEMRYSAMSLGQEGTLGDGLVFAGVASGASFESLAFESRAKQVGLVDGMPAIFSEAQGGNGILAWEPSPGLVHYVGYSGSPSTPAAIEALRALADNRSLLTPAQWQTKDRDPVAAQSGWPAAHLVSSPWSGPTG